MSAELGAVVAIHWWKAVIGIVAGYFGFRLKQNYSEKEARLKNLEEKHAELSEAHIEQRGELNNLKEVHKDFTKKYEESQKTLTDIYTSVQVIKNDIQHIKEGK
jgi:chromosome segregation ATPase|tara:strand:+ start:1930 stop:2241 length:312 start_codon:yes stop_codon:yes gene_type:complete